MQTKELQNTFDRLLSFAGININGNNPTDIRIKDDRAYKKILVYGSLGLGESYMDEWWECDRIDEMINKILRAELDKKIKINIKMLWNLLTPRIFNLQSKKRALQIGERHYNLGNELFKNMLDERMVYSCAYWEDAQTLDEAQEKKLDLICKKLNIQSGMRILDIGCGWGSFIKYAAEKYNTLAVGITVSKEQVEFGRKLCAGLPIEIRLQDYREINERFDRIVSIGMIEHVGYKNYRTFMEKVFDCLNDNGLFLLHTIGGNISVKYNDPWSDKYIFPNSMLPSIEQLAAAFEGLFVMEDWQNISTNYDKTLMVWFENFNSNWSNMQHLYDKRFYRMWKFFLLSSAGAFRARKNQVWQIVLSKGKITGGYRITQ
jgi:cyclopropane-fatty-acyl-phospholipid synthase